MGWIKARSIGCAINRPYYFFYMVMEMKKGKEKNATCLNGRKKPWLSRP